MLDIRTEVVDGRAVVVPVGEVAVGSAPALRQALQALTSDYAVTIVDLDQVEVLDDLGLGVLLGGAMRARQRGGAFAVVCSRERIREVLELSRLDRAVDVHPTLADALAEVRD